MARALLHQLQTPGGRMRVPCNARRTRCAAQQAVSQDLSELMRKLEEDSKHMFSDEGLDVSMYADNVDFKDPITKYDSLAGFNNNLKFLKNAFDPTYKMLDIKQVNDLDVVARWTMGFDVVPIKKSPLGKWWQPRMEFTGTTIYGTNAETGKVERHYDTWDSVRNNEYFSVEAFKDVLRQIFQFQRTPELPTPPYTLLKRKSTYSIREYDPFVIAEVTEAGKLGSGSRSNAFRSLAGYIFGKNTDSSKLSMTTPVISSAASLQFALPVKSLEEAPTPMADSGVQIRQQAGGLYAAVRFSGKVSDTVVRERSEALRKALAQDGISIWRDDWQEEDMLLLQYNDPSTKAPFRRNEVLIRVTNFDLWSD